MKTKLTTWLTSLVPFALLGVLSWRMPRWLGLAGWSAIGVTSALLLLGLALSVLVFFVMRSRTRREPEVDGGAEIDETMAAAAARLAASNAAPDARIARLPLALVLGPTGSTKTSVIMHSGLDPELLAGEVMRGDTVIATEPLNVWYAHGTVLVEAGGRMLEDAARWRRLVRHLTPRRLAAALGRGRQAPRIAILCFACDDFVKPGASQNLHTLARQLRARLSEASQLLGIRLPVYVLFTRADRLPYFADYVRNLSNDEAEQVLGTTLPLVSEAGASWAETESRRLNDAFGRMLHALAQRRLDLLPREAQEPLRANAYEFPRELRKIVDPAVQLLVDIFRPSQLGENPLLRGFYFTGVRPVIIRDAAAEAQQPRSAAGVDAAATSVFSAALLQQAMQVAPSAGSGRKVPQWVFLPRVFRDIVLHDEAVLRLTGGGTRVDLLRRGLIGATAAAGLLLAVGFTNSFAKNGALLGRTGNAVRAAGDVGVVSLVGGGSVEQDLTRLDSLRDVAAELTRYQRGRRPLSHGWGLYVGNRIQPQVHAAYFSRFNAALWGATREQLQAYLAGLPAEPGNTVDFSTAQDALAAYLLTTQENQRSSAELLSPTLLRFWQRGEVSDSARELAARQFAFFGDELPHGHPLPADADEALVRKVQRLLVAFGADAYYGALIHEASREARSVGYSGPGVVRNPYTVPGAFTKAGEASVLESLKDVEELFRRYEWIYGSGTPRERPDPAQLERAYYQDYIAQWQTYLRSATVAEFHSTGDAATKLSILADPTNSPVVQVLAVAARETPADTATEVGRAFQPLHATVTVDDARGPGINLAGYTRQLMTLGSQLNLLPPSGGSEDAQRQAAAAADAVGIEVSALAANSFMRAGAAGVTAQAIERLLRSPAEAGGALVRRLPAAGLNQAGQNLCTQFRGLGQAYPFSARSQQDARVGEVAQFFRRPDGALWTFHAANLAGVITPQGRSTGAQRLNPGFEQFMARSAEFADAIFRDGAATVIFDFLPVQYPQGATEVLLEQDRATTAFTPSRNTSHEVVWVLERGQSMALHVRFGAERVTVADGDGEWAAFKLFRNATWQRDRGQWIVSWNVRGSQLRATVNILGSTDRPLLRDGYFAGFACTPTVVLN
jgi:type VI secretion system protein ImpL